MLLCPLCLGSLSPGLSVAGSLTVLLGDNSFVNVFHDYPIDRDLFAHYLVSKLCFLPDATV